VSIPSGENAIMPMTITEKILAAHAGLDRVEPGQIIMADVDVALGNDITTPIAIDEFERSGAGRLHDPERLFLVMDHFVPTKDIQSAMQVKKVRDFARKHDLPHYYEPGTAGIEHVFLPEQGFVGPGDLVIGADSHTVTYGALGAFSSGVGSTDLAGIMITGRIWLKVPETMRFVFHGTPRPWVGGKDLVLRAIGDVGVDGARYRAMEFAGGAVDSLSMDDRFTMANMAIEAGGKCGVFHVDEKTRAYVNGRCKRPWRVFASDPDAHYCAVREYDCAAIEPQVAFPHLPGNTRPVSLAGHVRIDQAVIGSCTNGRIGDLRAAAAVLEGRRVAPYVRLIVIPGSQQVYLQALAEGLLETFVRAGGVVSPPTCGPCPGGFMGIMADGEKTISTTNRNFIGRMGHTGSEIYLANPAVAAASAVAGRIVGPDAL
jgi:3-isopropylmalate/(R)-2-methylmalate dehydratase large subunit